MLLGLYSAVPIIFLIGSLTVLKKPAVVVAPITLIITVLLSFFVWQYPPNLMVYAALEGVLYGFWPIGVIIFGSLCLSNLMVASGSVKEIEEIVGTISSDVRIMVVLVAWGLESFLEAIAGFGSGLALPISVLTVMGVSPFKAGVVALLANSVPTAYGGVGIAIATLADTAGVALPGLMQQISYQLILPSLILPFVITRVVTDSWKKVFEIFWVPLFAGLGQGLGLMLPLNPALVAICSGFMNICGSILATVIFYPHLRVPSKTEWDRVLKTFSPFLLAIFLIVFTGPLVPMIYDMLSSIQTTAFIYPGAKPLVFKWLSNAGGLLFIAGVLGSWIQGLRHSEMVTAIKVTCVQLCKPCVVLMAILAMARIMTYSGMIDSLAQSIATYAGSLYPIFSPLLGVIGVLVTGSVTSSGILMGALQAEMGEILNLSPTWLVAMNISGSTAGKMLAPHSVAIVLAAIGVPQEEAKITSTIFKAVLIYLVGLMIISQIGVYINF